MGTYEAVPAGLTVVLVVVLVVMHRRQRAAAERVRQLEIEMAARRLLPLARAVDDPEEVADGGVLLVRRKGHLGLYVGGRDAGARGRRTVCGRARLAPGWGRAVVG